MRVILVNVFIFILSAGWLIPIGAGLASFDSWVWIDVFPVIYGSEKELHSFPYYQASKQLITYGFVWLAASVVIWGLYFAILKPIMARKNAN